MATGMAITTLRPSGSGGHSKDAVTGICHYVDNGQHPVGMHRVGSIDIYKDDYVFDEGGIAPLGEAPSAKF